MTDFNLRDLQKPFRPDQLEWRVQSSGSKNGHTWAMVLVYVTARDIFNRLDDVVGPENWSLTEPNPVYGTRTLYAGKRDKWIDGKPQEISAYSYDQNSLNECVAHDTQQNCLLGFNIGISIRINNEWVTRYDGADVTDFEPYKGGISSAVKRAGVPWGIGRYLYGIDNNFALIGETECAFSKKRDYIKGKKVKWLPPKLPAHLLPEGYDGDQWAHLLEGYQSHEKIPAQQEAPKPAAAPAAPPKDPSVMTTMIKTLTDMNLKASMASEASDKEEIANRIARARDHFGNIFSEGKIDDNELKQLQQMASAVEDTLKGS